MSLINLLVSDDRNVISKVRDLHRAIDSVQLHALAWNSGFEKAVTRSDVVLVIVHLSSSQAEEQASKMFDLQSRGKSRCSLIFLADGDVSPKTQLRILQSGAIDCLRLPYEEAKLRFLIETHAARRRVEFKDRASARSDQNITALDPTLVRPPEFLSSSPVMKRVVEHVQRLANLDTTVLLTGETGTGKTRLARLIHDQSHRRNSPFVHVDCASISESLIENELFGHTKGAYTGADRISEGRVAAAKDGTLFLDEVDALSPKAQASLLRLSDESRYTPVGGTGDVSMAARLIVGTNRNLLAEVQAGRFRQDLYYRLKVLSIELPPLRQRQDEIPELAQVFVYSTARRYRIPVPQVEPEVWEALKKHNWPGNVRELKNVIEQMMAFSSGARLTFADLPDAFRSTDGRPNPRHDMKESVLVDDQMESPPRRPAVTDSWIDRRFPDLNTIGVGRLRGEIGVIIRALTEAKNNRTVAAAALGISREALYKKLKKYDLMDFEL